MERNSALGVLVDIVGKGCPHRLQGRSFKVLKTTMKEFDTWCIDLLERVKGHGARFSGNPYSRIRGNKDIFSIVGEGVESVQFIVMVDEPEVELKEQHFFPNGEDVTRNYSDEMLVRIKVNEESELGIVVSVLQDKGETRWVDSSWDDLEIQLKAELPPAVNTFRKPLKLGYKPQEPRDKGQLSDVFVGDEFAIHQGDSWTAMYEDKHGDIVEFMAKHKKIFTVPERRGGYDGQNASWHDTDLDLKPNASVMLRLEVKVELVDNFLGAGLPLPVSPDSNPSSATNQPVIAWDRGDCGVPLPSLSALKARAEGILGMTWRGTTPEDDVIVYPESCPVGILIQALKKEGHILLPSIGNHLAVRQMGSSIKDRFPGFPGIKQFLSQHSYVFIQNFDEEKYEAKKKQMNREPQRHNFEKALLKNAACHHVISDDHFAKIFALVDDEIGDHGGKQPEATVIPVAKEEIVIDPLSTNTQVKSFSFSLITSFSP